jgi:hypothetical protein
MPSSGMSRHVDLVWTDVSEECIAHIFRVEKLAREKLARAGGADFSTLKMQAIRSSETSVHIRFIRRHIPEDGNLHSYRRENLKSYKIVSIWSLCVSMGLHICRPNLVW